MYFLSVSISILNQDGKYILQLWLQHLAFLILRPHYPNQAFPHLLTLTDFPQLLQITPHRTVYSRPSIISCLAALQHTNLTCELALSGRWTMGKGWLDTGGFNNYYQDLLKIAVYDFGIFKFICRLVIAFDGLRGVKLRGLLEKMLSLAVNFIIFIIVNVLCGSTQQGVVYQAIYQAREKWLTVETRLYSWITQAASLYL